MILDFDNVDHAILFQACQNTFPTLLYESVGGVIRLSSLDWSNRGVASCKSSESILGLTDP